MDPRTRDLIAALVLAAQVFFTELDFEHFYLQPMDGPEAQRNTQLTLEYCKLNPTWSLSLQTHKILDIP